MKRGRGLEIATWLSEPGRYLFVLFLTLTSFVFLASGPDEDWAPLVSVLIQGMTLLAVLRTSQVRPRIVAFARGLVILSAAATAATLLASPTDSRTSGYLVNGLLVALAPPAIAAGLIRDVKARGAVTGQTVFGALSIYVLFGMFFATVYLAIDQLYGDQFFASQPNPTPPNFQYFSFITLLTVGYGDFTPATDLGRTLAVCEGLIGQIYLVTVVAALVATVQRRGMAGSRPGPAGPGPGQTGP